MNRKERFEEIDFAVDNYRVEPKGLCNFILFLFDRDYYSNEEVKNKLKLTDRQALGGDKDEN